MRKSVWRFCVCVSLVSAFGLAGMTGTMVTAAQRSVKMGKASSNKDFKISKGVLTSYKGKATKVTIPKSVKKIGDSAFSGKTKVKSITLPSSVTSIGKKAFWKCSSLTSLTVPAKVSSIGSDAFGSCRKLKKLTVSSKNKHYASSGNAICKKGSRELLFGCAGTKISSGIRYINENAFAYCTGLKSINIPSTVTYIPASAFRYCTALQTIKVDSKNRVYNSNGGCNGIVETATEKLVVGCKGTIITSAMKAIGSNAFYGCSGLRVITISNGVKSIEAVPFKACNNLSIIKVAQDNSTYDSRNDCDAVVDTLTNAIVVGCKSTKIPDTVKALGDSAFAGCTGLKNISIPAKVEEIGVDVFDGCTSLKSITVSSANTHYDSRNNCNAIIETKNGKVIVASAFREIPKSTMGYAPDVFYDGSKLKKLTIPENICEIAAGAFSNCTALTQMTVVSTNMKYDSRENCNAIIYKSTNTLVAGCKNTKIPSTVTEIGDKAFENKTMSSMTLPGTLMKIRYLAFYNCKNLKKVAIPKSMISVANDAFVGCDSLGTIKVDPANGMYTSGNGCNAIIDKVSKALIVGCKNSKIMDDVEKIGANAFYNCVGLKEITIGQNVKKIDTSAFQYCTNLKKVTVLQPEKNYYNDKSIGLKAFRDCYRLEYVRLPESVYTIDTSAFVNCHNLVIDCVRLAFAQQFAITQGYDYKCYA